MKSTIFWDITLCSPLKANRLFGGIYILLDPEDGGDIQEDRVLHSCSGLCMVRT
jgi:hypothetical protein